MWNRKAEDVCFVFSSSSKTYSIFPVSRGSRRSIHFMVRALLSGKCSLSTTLFTWKWVFWWSAYYPVQMIVNIRVFWMSSKKKEIESETAILTSQLTWSWDLRLHILWTLRWRPNLTKGELKFQFIGFYKSKCYLMIWSCSLRDKTYKSPFCQISRFLFYVDGVSI